MKKQMGVAMKHFMIWPILVPAIAFCQDDIIYHDELDTGSSIGCHCHGSGGSWNTKDHDDFLQEPLWGCTAVPGDISLRVEGTITEVSGCHNDIYFDEYDMNDDEGDLR